LSRPRSGRGASASASRPVAAQRGVYVQSPKSDIFVALLGVALGAMVLGCLLLIIVWGRYEFKTKISALTPTPARAIALAAGRVAVETLPPERT
jgi:hypothetical protein